MKIDRKKNAVRNIFWGIINRIVLIILPFAIRIILINILGKEYLGLNSLFSSLLQVLNLTELGFGSAMVFSMYKPIAEDDTIKICELLSLYKRTYRIIGTIIGSIGIVIIPFIPILIEGSYPANINIYIVYLIYLANTVISYFVGVYKTSLFIAHNRSDVLSKISTIVTMVSYCLQILVLFMTRSYYFYITLLPIFTAVTNIIQAYSAKRMYPKYYCYGTLDKESKREIKKRICGLATYKVYGVVFSSVDSIIISAFLGLVSLATYNNYYYIVSSVAGVLTIITNSLTAGIGNSTVLNTVEKNREDFDVIVFINAWVVTWCSICMIVLFQPFIQLWLGSDYLLNYRTVILMVIMFYFSRLANITSVYKEALGLWWEDRIRPIVATFVNLATNIMLVNIIGLDGVIISTIICSVCINIPWGTHVLFKNYFRSGMTLYFKNIFIYACCFIISSGVTCLITRFTLDNLLLEVIIKGILCVVIPNLIYGILLYNCKQFKNTKLLILSMVKKYQ